jgi:putative endopeptidase
VRSERVVVDPPFFDDPSGFWPAPGFEDTEFGVFMRRAPLRKRTRPPDAQIAGSDDGEKARGGSFEVQSLSIPALLSAIFMQRPKCSSKKPGFQALHFERSAYNGADSRRLFAQIGAATAKDITMKALFLLSAIIMAIAPLAAAADGHGIDKAAMDTSLKPGDDFYGYVNGGWLKHVQIPADQSAWGVVPELRQQALERTRGLLEGSHGQAGDFYAAYMDKAGIEKRGLAPVQRELARIAAVTDRKSLARALGMSLRADVDPINNTNFHTENLFGLWTGPGFNDSTHYAVYLLQGGLAMPGRDYYLESSDRMKANQAAYRAYIAILLKAAGITDPDGKAKAIYDLEYKIAHAQASMVESQEVTKANNPWARDKFGAEAPGLDWDAFFTGAGLEKPQTIVVWQVGAVRQLAALVGSEPVESWKAYLSFHALNHAAPVLPKTFADAQFNFFDKTLSGTPEQAARWKRAVAATNTALGDAVGRLYAARYFSPQTKARIQVMVQSIIAAFDRRLDKLDWLAPATRAEAKHKLKVLYVGIGYPEHWHDYAGLRIARDDAAGNVARAEMFEYHRQVARIGKPVDRMEWSMTPQTVNAVNLPLQNALNFPAAYLERPNFDAQATDAFNYGAIGSTIGHEVSHSFDNQGSAFDATGALRNWWTPADFQHFGATTKALAAQFDAYRPFPDLAVNGTQTLGENIADNAGLTAAYEAWKISLGGKPAQMDHGFTGDQQFFLANAGKSRGKQRDAALRRQVLTNEQAPSQYRALEVRNLDGWYAAFDVKPGDKQYLAPAARVRVW